jgi:hypothetical protein
MYLEIKTVFHFCLSLRSAGLHCVPVGGTVRAGGDCCLLRKPPVFKWAGDFTLRPRDVLNGSLSED